MYAAYKRDIHILFLKRKTLVNLTQTCLLSSIPNVKYNGNCGIHINSRNTSININSLRYADDTTLMAESEEDLKSFLRVKEECEKGGLRFNIQKTK